MKWVSSNCNYPQTLLYWYEEEHKITKKVEGDQGRGACEPSRRSRGDPLSETSRRDLRADTKCVCIWTPTLPQLRSQYSERNLIVDKLDHCLISHDAFRHGGRPSLTTAVMWSRSTINIYGWRCIVEDVKWKKRKHATEKVNQGILLLLASLRGAFPFSLPKGLAFKPGPSFVLSCLVLVLSVVTRCNIVRAFLLFGRHRCRKLFLPLIPSDKCGQSANLCMPWITFRLTRPSCSSVSPSLSSFFTPL